MPTLRLAKTLWGVPEADDPDLWDELFARIKAEGFDGVEAITLTWRTDRDRFVSLLKKHGLQLICQIHTSGGDLDPATGYVYCSSNKLHDHLASFVKLTAEAKALGAVLINSHSGHDSWGSGDKAVAFFKHALLVEAQLGVPVVHETHRQRLLYSPCEPPPTPEPRPLGRPVRLAAVSSPPEPRSAAAPHGRRRSTPRHYEKVSHGSRCFDCDEYMTSRMQICTSKAMT